VAYDVGLSMEGVELCKEGKFYFSSQKK